MPKILTEEEKAFREIHKKEKLKEYATRAYSKKLEKDPDYYKNAAKKSYQLHREKRIEEATIRQNKKLEKQREIKSIIKSIDFNKLSETVNLNLFKKI
jgi:hypothetical protein